MQRGSFLKVVPTPYTNLKGIFKRGLLKIQRKFTILTCPYTYSILKWVFGNLIFKFRLENFLHQYESIGLF